MKQDDIIIKLLDQLAQSLAKSANPTAGYFTRAKEALLQTTGRSETIKILDNLGTIATVAHFGSYTADQERMLNELAHAVELVKAGS